MKIKEVTFIKSSQRLDQCPDATMPEFAFIGRSNVGKSSLINMLTGRKNLAKTSSTPGKTQLINHYAINNSWFLVDLPGYGFSKTNKNMKEDWEKNISYYLQNRSNLFQIFILVDLRLEPQNNDLQFIEWVLKNEFAFSIIFTKADKLSGNAIQTNFSKYVKTFKAKWKGVPQMFISSAENERGKEEILLYISDLMEKEN